MSVELTGPVSESFEWAATASGIVLSGCDGRLVSLRVEWPEPWSIERNSDGIGLDLRHPSGAAAGVRIRSGRRIRVEMFMCGRGTVPGPIMRVEAAHTPIAWLAGSSGEVVIPSPTGPGLLVQRRGDSAPSLEPDHWFPLREEVSLAPSMEASAAWTYEAYDGGLWDIPAEPSWLPMERYVVEGTPVYLSAPDGRVDARCEVRESDGEYEIFPGRGVTSMRVWDSAGPSVVEIGGYVPLSRLRANAAGEREGSGEGVYLAVRHLLESWVDNDLLDWVDDRLARWHEEPSPWLAAAARLATSLGLPERSRAEDIATQVLAHPTADDVVILALHGLAPVELASGQWPVGDLARVGIDAIGRLGYGRIRNSGPRPTGRDVALARLYVAGLGENEEALRISSYIQCATNELMCRLSASAHSRHIAWLSLQEA